MGGLLDRLAEGRAKRGDMVRRFGFVPTSVLRLTRGALSRRMFTFQHEQEHGSISAAKVHSSNLEQMTPGARAKALELARLGMVQSAVAHNNADGQRIQTSILPAEIVEFFAKYYAEAGQVYVDPFMGHGIRMQVAKVLGMHYYGNDICREYVAYIEAVRSKIDDGTTTISVNRGDARSLDAIPDGIGDFVFTSPPYWDLEFYDDSPEQLGIGHTYEEFLAGMEEVARALLRKVKPSAYVVINVNDFRRDGRFYAYHADTIALFVRAGWAVHDTWIVEGLVGGLPKVFAVDKNASRIAPKLHEYAIVFRPPS